MTASLQACAARAALSLSLVGGLLAGTASVTLAQVPSGCSVFASGLAAPRFVTVDPTNNDVIYVTEAGTGGADAIARPAQLPPQVPVASNRGLSGRVTRLGPGAARSAISANLPSYASPTEQGGAAGLAVSGGNVIVAVGNPGPLTPFVSPLANDASVLRIPIATVGVATKIADIGAIERDRNPDPNAVDTNLYGLAIAPNGTIYVVDAGGNAVYRVNPTTGAADVLAVIPGLPSPQPNPARGGRNEMDPVPTGIAVGADGNLYVGLLSGAPFPEGAAKVLRITPTGQISDFATGLTAVTGVAVGPDRNVYVSEIFRFNPAAAAAGGSPFGPGRVLRVLPNGTTQVVAANLNTPNGLAFDRAGNLYIATGTVTPDGQILRCANVAGALALPATGAGAGLALPAAIGAATLLTLAAFALRRRSA
ncbi:MAG TPA: ScyD/ScyE family protein [Chloroflexota bacterium]|nr:ScyD/ScyE family protein [Chloroflexota bacterium]